MDRILIATFEELCVERSTPTTSAPVKVAFQFHIGHDLFADVTAEVTEETDGDYCTGHDVTLLEVMVPAIDKTKEKIEDSKRVEIFPYADGFPRTLRAALENKAVECSHNSKYHIKN